MNILIIGSGAREHAIAIALHRSPQQLALFCCGATQNPGIKQMTHGYWVGDINDVDTIVMLAKEWQIGLAIIGPAAPLERGLSDALWRNAIPTVGPRRKLAQIETSKAFARDLMQKHHIPGLPRYRKFFDMAGINEFLTELGEGKYVVKANGLMGGKGVKVAGDHLHSFSEALACCRELLAQGQTVLIEEKLIGVEFALMCFCDGEHLIPMPLVQDHKRAFDGDKGPNTGGMGSYSDANHLLPFLNQKHYDEALLINNTVYRALMSELNEKYIGILYGSFIATSRGVDVIEFNARFGDPEALNVLTILESDFASICQAMVMGNLKADTVCFAKSATVCKYAVPNGYPDARIQDIPIEIGAVKNKARLYLAGVNVIDGKIMANAARVAAYVGVADTIFAAEEIAEKEVCAISGPLFHRKDIGTDYLIQSRIEEMRKLQAES